MNKTSPSWKICVVTGVLPSPWQCTEIANALLYGDEVLWIPIEPALFRPEPSSASPYWTEVDNLRGEYLHFYSQIRCQQLPIHVPPLPINRIRDYPAAFLYGHQFLEYSKILSGESELVIEYIQEAQALVIDPKSPYALQTPPYWHTRRAAQTLMNALSRVLLPDVSGLPLAEISELRDRVKDELDPMRGELLLLTEVLRERVAETASMEEIAREAENLIQSRVESVVRQVASHIEAEMGRRWRKLLEGSLKFFGLAGLGFLDPKFTEPALKQAVEVISQAADVTSAVKPSTATAHFVLELRHNLGKKGKK